MVVSAAVTEMMISLLHHPNGGRAPLIAGTSDPSDTHQPGSCLGMVPHQIRGSIATFEQMVIGGEPFDKCTACGGAVLNEYHSRGTDFVIDACNNRKLPQQFLSSKDLITILVMNILYEIYRWFS